MAIASIEGVAVLRKSATAASSLVLLRVLIRAGRCLCNGSLRHLGHAAPRARLAVGGGLPPPDRQTGRQAGRQASFSFLMASMQRYGRRGAGASKSASRTALSLEDLPQPLPSKRTLFSYFVPVCSCVDEDRDPCPPVPAAQAPSPLAHVAGDKDIEAPGRFTQLYLDLGQRHFGHIVCADCGMAYSPTLDAKVHQAFHRHFLRGMQFQVCMRC